MRAPCSLPRLAVLLISILWIPSIVHADIKLPSIFGSHMVLQQKQANRVWGWGDAQTEITVTIADQVKKTAVGEDGRWQVTLDPLPAGGPHRMTISGDGRVTFDKLDGRFRVVLAD